MAVEPALAGGPPLGSFHAHVGSAPSGTDRLSNQTTQDGGVHGKSERATYDICRPRSRRASKRARGTVISGVRRASLVALIAGITMSVAPVAGAQNYPIPRKDIRQITVLCARAAAHNGDALRNVRYTPSQIVCSFGIRTYGTDYSIRVTRPTYCDLRFRLFVGGRLDSQTRMPFYC